MTCKHVEPLLSIRTVFSLVILNKVTFTKVPLLVLKGQRTAYWWHRKARQACQIFKSLIGSEFVNRSRPLVKNNRYNHYDRPSPVPDGNRISSNNV